MNGSLVFLAATTVVVAVLLGAGGHRRLGQALAARRDRRALDRLTRSAPLDYRWADRIAISGSHLHVVGAMKLGAPDETAPTLPPSRFRLDDLEAISQKQLDGQPLLIVTLRRPAGGTLQFGCLLPDRDALDEVYDAINRHGRRAMEARERRQFDELVAGATLDYRWGNEIGTDADTLYAIRFQPVSAEGKPGAFLPPTRYPLRDLREIGQAPGDEHIFLTMVFTDQDGREFQVCHALPDQATCAQVYDEIRARAFPADPPTSANAPTPLVALLRTIAAREIDARPWRPSCSRSARPPVNSGSRCGRSIPGPTSSRASWHRRAATSRSASSVVNATSRCSAEPSLHHLRIALREATTPERSIGTCATHAGRRHGRAHRAGHRQDRILRSTAVPPRRPGTRPD